jgi:carboxypeptidase C (cathepsin A)
MLDEQPWHGQARYRSQGYQDWYFRKGDITSDVQGWDVKRGGFWKGTERLALYAIDEAGHFAPYHQPEAVGAVLRAWLGTSDTADQRASG